MGMTHMTSGKQGYRLHYQPTAYYFTREKILKVINIEDKLRLSTPYYQDQYTSCGDDTTQIAKVTEQIQIQALKDSGIWELDIPQALIALRNMRHDWRYDNDVLNSAIYHRADHCTGGKVFNGMEIEDVSLVQLDGNVTTLLNYYRQVDPNMSKPLVIVSGSVT